MNRHHPKDDFHFHQFFLRNEETLFSDFPFFEQERPSLSPCCPLWREGVQVGLSFYPSVGKKRTQGLYQYFKRVNGQCTAIKITLLAVNFLVIIVISMFECTPMCVKQLNPWLDHTRDAVMRFLSH